MNMIDNLREKNNINIYSCDDKDFAAYGRIVTGVDFSEIIEYADKSTSVPDSGNIYIASDLNMENLNIANYIRNNLYGKIDIQIGYCNGNSISLNALEYHKCSEYNIAVTDFVLFLARLSDIENGKINSLSVKAFYIPKGYTIELYQTTLHFAPCRVSKYGYKCIVILSKGTNLDLDIMSKDVFNDEDKRLFKTNKWILVHPERTDLIDKGAYDGILGDNIVINN